MSTGTSRRRASSKASGDHGHGFKHCAGIGELLAQLAVGEEPYCDAGFLDPDRVEEAAAAVQALPRAAAS